MKKLLSKKHYNFHLILFWLCLLIIIINIGNSFNGQNMNVPEVNQQSTITSSQLTHPIATGAYSVLALGFWPKYYGNDWQIDHTAAGMTPMMYQYVYKINYGIYSKTRGLFIALISMLALFFAFSFTSSRRKAAMAATISTVFLIANLTGCCSCQKNTTAAEAPEKIAKIWTYHQPAEMRVSRVDNKLDIAKIQSANETVIDSAVKQPRRHLDTNKIQWKEPEKKPEKKEVEVKIAKVAPKKEAAKKQAQPPHSPVQAKTTAENTVPVKNQDTAEKAATVYQEITLQYEMIVYAGQEKTLPEGSLKKLRAFARNYQQTASTTKNLFLRIIGHASGENNRKIASHRIQVVRKIIEQELPDKLKRSIEMVNLDDAMPVYRADGKVYENCVEMIVLTKNKPEVKK